MEGYPKGNLPRLEGWITQLWYLVEKNYLAVVIPDIMEVTV
jgi:hypothetical protein